MKPVFRIVSALMFAFFLAACGGGEDETPCPPNVPCTLLESPASQSGADDDGVSISLSLVDDSGHEIQNVTATSPGTLIAIVAGTDEPTIVTFDSTIGELPIKSAVTDANGEASVNIFASTELGAGTVTATLASGKSATAIIVVGVTDVQMGSGSPFSEGVAEVSTTQISAGGTASVTVMLQDSNGTPFNEPAQVNFSSTCSQLSPAKAILDSPVVLVNGVATSTYQAKGCVGDDPIRVSANVGGRNLSASASIKVLPATAGSITFVSATPELIGIKDAGLNETSTVVFQVMDTSGNPVSNKAVNFTLNNNMGGVTLSQPQAISDANGLVQIVVNSGTVATTVRVTASVDGSNPELTSQSGALVISTGIPDQDSFTAVPETLNPECWDYVGERIAVHAMLADAFNNPPADGTAVYFTTEGGAIDASCQTVSGSCSVNFYCQQPIPISDGRATVLATAIGEESFPDHNGNGRLDAGSETDAFLNSMDVSGKPFDLEEAFVDYNENGLYDSSNNEELVDFNANGTFDAADRLYNGVLCARDTTGQVHAGCADPARGESRSINIRQDFVIVMSGSTGFGSNIQVTDSSNNNGDSVLDIYGEEVGQAILTIADLNNQQMPAGTKVTFTATVGNIVSQDSFVWPSSNAPGGMSFGVAVKGETTPKSGTLMVETLTPNGVSTQITVASITIH